MPQPKKHKLKKRDLPPTEACGELIQVRSVPEDIKLSLDAIVGKKGISLSQFLRKRFSDLPDVPETEVRLTRINIENVPDATCDKLKRIARSRGCSVPDVVRDEFNRIVLEHAAGKNQIKTDTFNGKNL